MSESRPRILLVSYGTYDVSIDIPFLFKRAGCAVDIYCGAGSLVLENGYWDAWHPAGDTPETFASGLFKLTREGSYDWVVLGDDDSVRVVQDLVPPDLAEKILPLSKLEHRSLLGSKAGLSVLSDTYKILTPSFALYSGGDGSEEAAQVSFPLLMKVDRSAGGKGVFLCNTQADVEKTLSSLPYAKKQNLVFQKYIAGDNISVEALYRKGVLLGYASSRVLENLSGEFTVSSVRSYGLQEDLEDKLLMIGETFGFNGFCSFTFMRAVGTTDYYLVEADLRPHSWFVFSRFAGVDFSDAIRRFLSREDIPHGSMLRPLSQEIELRHPFRDINWSFAEWDAKNVAAWCLNRHGRWKLLPSHDRKMFAIFLKRLFWMRRDGLYLCISQWGKKTGSLWTYLQYYRTQKSGVALSLFLSLVQTVSLVPVPLVAKEIFDHALPQGNTEELLIALGILTALFLANSLISLTNRYVTLGVSKKIVYVIRRDLIFRALSFNRTFFAVEDLDLMHSRVVQDTERLDRVLSGLLSQAFPNVLVALALGCLLLYLSPILAMVMAIVLPALYATGRIAGKRLREQVRLFHKDFSEFSKGVSFVFKFNELIALSTAEEMEFTRQDTIIRNVHDSSKKMALFSAVYGTIQGNILVLGGLLVILFGGFQVAEGVITLGAMLSFYIALNILSSSVRSILGVIPQFVEGGESLAALQDILKRPVPSSKVTQSFNGFKEAILFDAVSFSYGSRFALRGVTFSIQKGEVVGIFGASGSGKSTLIHLLLGFYAPQQGRISIDGRDLENSDIAGYRRAVGVLPQDPLMFSGTIRENLTYGLASVDEERMFTVCALCRIHDFISGLEKGYDTDMGNRSVRISGGQKQRIAIARALLRNPEIIILDEPDNNLDDVLISEIVGAIQSLGITVIIISHNRALREIVDKTLLVEDQTVRVV